METVETNYTKLNLKTWTLNQQGKDQRTELVDMISKTTGMNYTSSLRPAKSACYMITLLIDIWNKGIIKEPYTFQDIMSVFFHEKFFRPSDCWQLQSSVYILKALVKQGYIKKCSFTDCDYRNKGETRQSVYNQLIKRMEKKNFLSARVCFGEDASGDHAITVTNNENGDMVVCDTSWRSHATPGNSMHDWITPLTIRWWTEIRS